MNHVFSVNHVNLVKFYLTFSKITRTKIPDCILCLYLLPVKVSGSSEREFSQTWGWKSNDNQRNTLWPVYVEKIDYYTLLNPLQDSLIPMVEISYTILDGRVFLCVPSSGDFTNRIVPPPSECSESLSTQTKLFHNKCPSLTS